MRDISVKADTQTNEAEQSPEITPWVYSQLNFYKSLETWEKDNPLNELLGEVDSHITERIYISPNTNSNSKWIKV